MISLMIKSFSTILTVLYSNLIVAIYKKKNAILVM